jgi:predicted RecB family nuclease
MARFVTSPSRIARFFFHQCDRQFRYFATPKARRKEEGVPAPPWDQSPVTQAILESGYAWEAEVVTKRLSGRVAVAKGGGRVFERQHDVPATLRQLESARHGTFIYQPTFQTPKALYDDYGLDPSLVEFTESRPDLVEVVRGPKGRRLLRVHDLKASDELKLTHRIQVALYSLQLDSIVREHGIDADVDLEAGGIWLADRDEPKPFELAMTRPHVDRFLRSDLPRILSTPPAETRGHLCFRCEWCEYFESCYQEADRRRDVSLLPYLSTSARRFLADEGIDTLPQLKALLTRKDSDEVLSRCASLEGRRPRLSEQVKALESGKVLPHGGRSVALPIGEHVKVFLTAQSDPVTGEPYLFGLLVRARKELLGGVLKGCGEPEVFLSEKRGDVAANRARFVARIHEVLEAVHAYNAPREWGQQLSLQTYVYDSFERQLVVDALFEEMKGRKLGQEALQLLLHFVDPGLAVADEHAEPEAGFPVVVLTEAIRDLLALPVPVGYRLQEALEQLPVPGRKPFSYRAFDYYHFPLSNRLRADAIFAAWNGDAGKLPGLEKETSMRLWATGALLDGLRAHAAGLLFAWPPKFRFPEPWEIDDPLLSRLAFLERFESISACNALRAARAQGPEERLLRGNALLLRALGPRKLRVLRGDLEVEPGPWMSWLVARSSPEGERDVLAYADYHARGRFFYGRDMEHAAVVKVTAADGDALTVEFGKNALGGVGLLKGEEYVLVPRFLDATADRIIEFLQGLDTDGFFRRLLEKPSRVLGPAPVADSLSRHARRQLVEADLTESQQRAFRRLLEHRGALVWGPPGTGKTHFIAAAILALAHAHAKAGKRFHVAVSAFTHAAIENVLGKLAELSEQDLPLAKLEGWRGIGGLPEGVREWDAKDAGAKLADLEGAVVGGTVFALRKIEVPAFDLVVLDEASQMRCPQASIPASVLAPDGRILVAGDDMQLPPVIQGHYPDPEDGSPPLHRSIFEVLRLKEAPVEQLLENFRMNDVLTRFAAESLYGPDYRCASAAVAGRRLAWSSKRRDEDGFERFCLDPEYPLVLAVLEGVFASRANPEEAALAARLVAALRAGLEDEGGKPFPATAEGDAAFFREGVFVVSPHHAQIRELHRALAEERDWLAEPFVDTVDKMQGQEASAVVVSYGVSDADFALDEGEFIYSRNRLNVSITRAQSKCVVFLPRPLLDASPAVMDDPVASEGLRFMRGLEGYCRGGEERVFDAGEGVTIRAWRVGTSR